MAHTHLAALTLRLSMGGMMIPHGWSKFEKLLSGKTGFADPIGIGELPTLLLAVVAELLCPILVIVGFKSKMASILPAITMLVAAFIVHSDDPWKKKEFALLYFFGFVAIYFLDSGKYSLDWKLKKG